MVSRVVAGAAKSVCREAASACCARVVRPPDSVSLLTTFSAMPMGERREGRTLAEATGDGLSRAAANDCFDLESPSPGEDVTGNAAADDALRESESK